MSDAVRMRVELRRFVETDETTGGNVPETMKILPFSSSPAMRGADDDDEVLMKSFVVSCWAHHHHDSKFH